MSTSPADLAPRLLAWLRATLAQPELTISALTAPTAGYSNVTLLGTLHSSATRQRDFVLRLQPPGDSIYPDHDVTRQYRVMQALARGGIPVPDLLGLETDPSLLGGPFYLMTRIEGRVPNENPLYHLEGWFHDLPAEHQRRCWFAGIDMLGKLARLDWRALGLQFLLDGANDPEAPNQSPLARQLDYYARAVRWAEQLAGREYPLLHAGERWLRAHRPVAEPLAFSWGDAKLGNCIFDGDELAAVLDFEQATIANPVDDLAWWLMLDDSLSRGYGVPRLVSLPARAETIARWEAASGFEARDLDYYEVYAAWRMAFVMARIAHIFRTRGWIAPDSDMDVNNGGATLIAAHLERSGVSVSSGSQR